MFCPNCGNQVNDESRFCPTCGTCLINRQNTDNVFSPPQNTTPQPRPFSMSESDIFAIAGFVLAFLFPIVGIIFSKMALNRNTNYKTLAKAGFVLSIVITVLTVIAIVMNIVFLVLAVTAVPADFQNF